MTIRFPNDYHTGSCTCLTFKKKLDRRTYKTKNKFQHKKGIKSYIIEDIEIIEEDI